MRFSFILLAVLIYVLAFHTDIVFLENIKIFISNIIFEINQLVVEVLKDIKNLLSK